LQHEVERLHELGIFAAVHVEDSPRSKRRVVFQGVAPFEITRGQRVVFLEGEFPEL
jgi:hypothetical protein